MERLYVKALHAGSKATDGAPTVHTFVASTDVVDRQGEIVTADGWELENYRANPVVLDSHDYRSIENILGIAHDIRQADRGLEVDVVFNNTPKGRLADQLVEEGNLRAVSVGFVSKEVQFDPKGKGPVKHTRKELLEVSAVAVPANPEALLVRGLAQKGAIPPHTTPKADENAPWDAAAEVRQAEGAEQLRQMHAWVDNEGDPEAKSSYKLPHHKASGEVVWRGVAAAMAALLGARGGVQIPESDRKGVYVHLERHYRQFEKEPPEFKSAAELSMLGEEEIKGLFYEGEWALWDVEKVGRVLSRKNEDALRQARDLIDQVLSSLGEEPEEPKALDIDLSALVKFTAKEK
jgi:HK97 family phage prohead protease